MPVFLIQHSTKHLATKSFYQPALRDSSLQHTEEKRSPQNGCRDPAKEHGACGCGVLLGNGLKCATKPPCAVSGPQAESKDGERQGTSTPQGVGGVISFKMHALPNFFCLSDGLGLFLL